MPGFRMDRRAFLKQASLLGAAAALPLPLLNDPYAPLPKAIRKAEPVRIRGRIASGGRGLANVAVTDGLSIVRTGTDGQYELVSSTDRPFVYLSVPAGYRIPQNEQGTARFYRPIQPDARGEVRAPFDLERLDASDETHGFFVLADPQTQNAYEMGLLHEQTVPDVQGTVSNLNGAPVFGVACGDIMFDDLSLYPEYERAVSRMGIPFFQVIGNHDLDFEGVVDEASAVTFRRHFGPTYYSFDRGAVHYVVLDDVFWHNAGYFGYVDGNQLEWLRQDLSYVEPGRPVVVFTHIPALSTQYAREGGGKPPIGSSITNREAVYRLLEPYQAHIISGHTHDNEHVFEGGVHEHITGTTCGAWWSGPICYDGTPNGYAVYEVQGEDLRWRYKATGHEFNHQMRLYPAGADPNAPNEMVANVWDWDPEWTVAWYEDGVRKGLMARRVGMDPLSETLHRGPSLPERRTWVDPIPTGHLFYAPVSPEARDVRVEVTDRWGRTYTEALKPA